MQLFFHEEITENRLGLGPDESRHLVKALRKTTGDQLFCTNGKGILLTCKIDRIDLKKTVLSVIRREYQPPDDHYIHLAIAPTKNQDKMEWMIEKITEIGFHEITFIKTENSERNYLNVDRLEKKVIAACKQSLKTWKPKINTGRTYAEILKDPQFETFQKFIGYVDHKNQTHLMDQAKKKSSYLVLIGPEGDFSPAEIRLAGEHHVRACSLGRYRLRTETAGMVAVHTLNLIQSYPK